MNKDIAIIFNLCYLALFARLMYLWLDGFYDRKSFIDGVKILLVLVVGTGVAAFVTSRTGKNMEEIKGLICDKLVTNVWSCGGWPIFSDVYAKFLASLRSPLLSFMALPAMVAPLLANVYVARKIAEIKKLDAWELVRILGASFFLYYLLTNAPHVLSVFDAITGKFTSVRDTAAIGQKNMAQWGSTIQKYVEVFGQISFMQFPKALAFVVFLFAIIVSFFSTGLYLFQLLLLSMVPMHFFNGFLQEKATIMPGIRKLFTVAGMGALNGPLWLFFSVLPDLTPPQMIGGSLAYPEGDYWMLVGVIFLACIVFSFYYLGLFLVCLKSAGDLFTKAGA
jgi:hypothetical protein